MISSLLSLYIATTIQTPLNAEQHAQPTQPVSIVKTANFDMEEILETKSAPIKDFYHISPIIDAQGSIAIDMDTGAVLFEKNPHQRMPIASITKLMTILIILEENDVTDIVTVSKNAAETEGSQMYLVEGEQIALENLIYASIIHSANDAAIAMAEHNAGSVSAFVKKMNTKASELGLLNTHFANPVGLDQADNYSSAFDLAKIARHIHQNQFIRYAAQLKELEVKSVSGKFVHKLQSTNDLLGNAYINFKGLKTGKTDAAGLCLTSIAENDTKNEIITIVLNSPARFTETKILTDWIFRAYTW